MEIFEAIHGRRSIRSFQNKEVEQEKIQQILEAAIKAPSAGNTQPWEFILVQSAEQKDRIVDAALGQSFIAEAPVVIVVCTNLQRSTSRYGTRGKELYCIQDCANATMLLELSAYALGLGTCWVGAFNEQEVSEILKLPEHIRPLAIIPVGYPSEDPQEPSRLELEKVTHKERF